MINQIYQMKTSFDNKATWYQLEWQDIEFKDFEVISKSCNDINELNSKILDTFPNCNLKYEYLGERKKYIIPKEKKKKK